MNSFYIETYGCRMNICDSEVIIAILNQSGYTHTLEINDADIIILNSCSVREDGHNKIHQRLVSICDSGLSSATIIIAGCFASILKKDFFEKYPFVDIIVNPNCYRELPLLLSNCRLGKNQIVVVEDNLEMYSDISPIRTFEDKTTAAITVMKGCNQFCTYCIEPFTRGREHSMNVDDILREAKKIEDSGYKEITLVGHLIDKYKWVKSESSEVVTFAKLLEMVANHCKNIRIKFLSSHPSYFTDDIVDVIARNDNIMRVVHLPLQSGSNSVLNRMNRGYSVEKFIERVNAIRNKIPNITIISDIIVGFCGETENDFNQTMDVVKKLKFDNINIFKFSIRSKTLAADKYEDNILENVKIERAEIIAKINEEVRENYFKELIGAKTNVVVEGCLKNSGDVLYGRNVKHQTVFFEKDACTKINDSIAVLITGYNEKGLIGKIVR